MQTPQRLGDRWIARPLRQKRDDVNDRKARCLGCDVRVECACGDCAIAGSDAQQDVRRRMNVRAAMSAGDLCGKRRGFLMTTS